MPLWASEVFHDVASGVTKLYGRVVHSSLPLNARALKAGPTGIAPGILEIYSAMAAIGARSLPEDIDYGLLHAWIAATRRESFAVPTNEENFDQALSNFLSSIAEAIEAIERDGGIELAGSEFQRRVIYVLVHDGALSLGDACHQVLESLASGTDVGDEAGRRAAYVAAKGQICDWLSQSGIEFCIESPVILPAGLVRAVLEMFSNTPDLYIDPDIPEHKLNNALNSCWLPEFDRAVALVDCTIFGAADEAVLFGTRGMYYNDGARMGYVPYSNFPKRSFAVVPGDERQISLGNNEVLDITGSKATVSQVVAVLEMLKSVSTDRKKNIERRDLLPGEPRVGESIGLSVREDDGAILRFEIQATAGHGRIVPLGSMEPVMRESIEAAAQYVRGNCRNLQIDASWGDNYDIAVMVPRFSETKDGPSSGVAIVTGIVSALTNRPVRNDTAMTGEITMKGRVLAIGGLHTKVRAAYEAGVKEVLFPAENLSELQTLPFYIRDAIRLTPVSTVDEVLRAALLPADPSSASTDTDDRR